MQAYRLRGQAWEAAGAAAVPPGYSPVRVAVDDSGNGWFLARTGTGDARVSLLVRLPAQGAPRAVDLAAAAGATGGQVVVINELSVAAGGQGWAAGYVATGTATARPLFLRLSGDTLTAVPASRFSLPADFTLPATIASVSPDGRTAWIGNESGQMAALSETTQPGMPRTGSEWRGVPAGERRDGLVLRYNAGVRPVARRDERRRRRPEHALGTAQRGRQPVDSL
jgi:hypothetical protein